MGKFLELAKQILENEGRAMRATEIIEKARELGFMDFSGGATPHQTIKARISDDINKRKKYSDFKRVGKGLFALRNFGNTEYNAQPFVKRISQSDYVLVIDSEKLKRFGLFNGIKANNYKKHLEFILNKKNGFFIPRLRAEKETKYKQILSYILVEKNQQLLQFVRGVYTNADSMLRGSFCIGFGGHVQSDDLNLFEEVYHDNGFTNSVKRELLEELKIPESSINQDNLKIIGILNDDSSEVGKSHIAIVQKLNLDKIEIGNVKTLKGEKSINQLKFVPINELGKDFEMYEYWSKLCIKTFFKKSVGISCKIHKVKNYSLSSHKQIILIVGAIGSGKTEASRILETRFGYTFISSGNILQELMGIQPISLLGRKIFQDKAYDFIRTEHGFDLIADKILSRISGSNGNFVIDGVRNIRTFEILKSALGKNCSLIFVESTPDNCYKFFMKRENGKINEQEFYTYLNHPVEKDVKPLLGKANIVVYNHGSLQSYQTEINKYFKIEFGTNNKR
jgi:predicted NUDIX family phosphoesterase/dephospho-CoA kinase